MPHRHVEKRRWLYIKCCLMGQLKRITASWEQWKERLFHEAFEGTAALWRELLFHEDAEQLCCLILIGSVESSAVSLWHRKELLLTGTASDRNCFWKVLLLTGTAADRNCFWKVLLLTGTAADRNCCRQELLLIGTVADRNCCLYELLLVGTAAERNCCW
jgi:hypothetical protein